MTHCNGFTIAIHCLPHWRDDADSFEAQVFVGERLVWLGPVCLSETLARGVASDWCCRNTPGRVVRGFEALALGESP